MIRLVWISLKSKFFKEFMARAKLTKEEKKFAEESELDIHIVSSMLHCSVGAVNYYRKRRNGIWRKKR